MGRPFFGQDTRIGGLSLALFGLGESSVWFAAGRYPAVAPPFAPRLALRRRAPCARRRPHAVAKGAPVFAMAPRSSGRRSALGASVRAIRPRAGQPYLRKYDDGRLAPRFSAISRALRTKGFPPDVVSERELSRLTGRLLAFSDATLGRDSDPSARLGLTKLPAQLFFDYSADGSLRLIIETCLQFAAQQGWDGLDGLREPSRREAHLLMLRACERALRSAKLMSVQMVYFSARLSSAEVESMRAIVYGHGGVVVSSAEVATHVVYPDPPGRSEAESDGQIMIRYLKREAKPGGVRALVHWYYHPDAYDDWIMAREIRGHVEPPPPDRGGAPWHVAARFLRDLDRFNEWMTEADYEMPEEFDAYEGMRPKFVEEAKAAKNAASEPRSVRLRLRMSDDSSMAPSAKRMRAASDGVSLVGLPSIARGVANNESNDVDSRQAQEEVAPRRSLRAAGRKPADVEAEEEEARIAAQWRPRYADWFDAKRVHEIERTALPEYFSFRYKSKNEKIYKQTRNFMIQTQMKTPTRYLSATAARRHLRGDASGIQRIHTFLEHWGLINFNVLPDTRPQQIYVPPPPPLPALAGRVDPVTGQKRSVLFLENGTPVDIYEGQVRRLHLDGTPLFNEDEDASDVTKNGGLGITGVTDSSLNAPITTPGAGYGGLSSSMQTPVAQQSDDADAMMSDRRPVRSTRYSSRRRRVSRYVDHSSGHEDDDDDDDDDGDDDDEEQDGAGNGDGAADGADDAQEEAERDGDAVEYHCDICSKDCTKVRYHCTQHADMDLCPDCYSERKYPSTMQPRDFIQMTATPLDSEEGGAPNDPLVWSESENLLLLEALEMYGENWAMVAEHVDSKSAVQCVLQLLRLPIEDDFLEDLGNSWWASEVGVKDADADASASGDGPPCPSDVLLKCGVRPEALQTVVEGFPSLTGKPLPFSDPVESVVPQVALIASETPREVLAKVLQDVDALSAEKRDSKSSADARCVDEIIADAVYRKRLAAIPTVNKFATSALGSLAASTALEELRRGSEKRLTALQNACSEGMSMPSAADGRSTHEMTNKSNVERPLESEDSGDPVAVTDFESKQAVATTALACGRMRAKELLAAEEEELLRVQSLLFELKLAMIHTKLEHLDAITRHHQVSQAASSRQRQEAFAAACAVEGSLVTGTLRDGDEAVFVVPSSSVECMRSDVGAPARRARCDVDGDFAHPRPGALLVRSVLVPPPVDYRPMSVQPTAVTGHAPNEAGTVCATQAVSGTSGARTSSGGDIAMAMRPLKSPVVQTGHHNARRAVTSEYRQPEAWYRSVVGEGGAVSRNAGAAADSGVVTGAVRLVPNGGEARLDTRFTNGVYPGSGGQANGVLPGASPSAPRPHPGEKTSGRGAALESSRMSMVFDATAMVRKPPPAMPRRVPNALGGYTLLDGNANSAPAPVAAVPSAPPLVQSKPLATNNDGSAEQTGLGGASASLAANGRL